MLRPSSLGNARLVKGVTCRRVGNLPVSSSTKESELLDGDIAGHELVHGMADEQIGVLDVLPKVLPNLLLG